MQVSKRPEPHCWPSTIPSTHYTNVGGTSRHCGRRHGHQRQRGVTKEARHAQTPTGAQHLCKCTANKALWQAPQTPPGPKAHQQMLKLLRRPQPYCQQHAQLATRMSTAKATRCGRRHGHQHCQRPLMQRSKRPTLTAELVNTTRGVLVHTRYRGRRHRCQHP
jgi:hypothetical protein